VAADYAEPQHVSPECKNLLRRLLTADPEKRVTIPDLLQHPWYQTSLPPGAANMNYNLLQSLVPAGLQSVEQIEETVQQATRVTAWPGWPQT
jgi:serine/threonine-protein kinase SRK2